jgi:hypothetical protein
LPNSCEVWAASTYASAALPDARLNKRAAIIASVLAARPLDSIPQAFGDWDQAKATYRFIENDRVTYDLLMEPVIEKTAGDCRGRDRIICVQDTTTLTFPNAATMKGLGPVNEPGGPLGMFVHSALAVGEDGVPIGLLHGEYWCRDPKEHGKAKQRRSRPVEEKESAKWLHGIRGARGALEQHLAEGERPSLIHVADREGDIHEIFEEILRGGDGAVIRCAQNRRVVESEPEIAYAHQAVRSRPVLARVKIDIPRKHDQPKRKATVEIRSCRVTLNPNRSRYSKRRPIPLSLVEVWEPNPPEGVERIRWLLWTTEPSSTLEEALEVVRIYRIRWVIEEVHLVLKSGCQIEELQFETVERTGKMLAFYAPVAIRVVQLRSRARIEPDSPCTVVLSEEEWHTLYAAIHRKPPPRGASPPTLRQAVLWIGRLGGHLNRKADGMPGVRSLWRGWRDLMIMLPVYLAGRRSV